MYMCVPVTLFASHRMGKKRGHWSGGRGGRECGVTHPSSSFSWPVTQELLEGRTGITGSRTEEDDRSAALRKVGQGDLAWHVGDMVEREWYHLSWRGWQGGFAAAAAERRGRYCSLIAEGIFLQLFFFFPL